MKINHYFLFRILLYTVSVYFIQMSVLKSLPLFLVRNGTLRYYTTRPHPDIDRIIRIDHAGEFGADRIYAGQVAVLGNSACGPVIKVCN